MVTFKYQENISHEELINIAQARLKQGYPLVVANRGEEQGVRGEQVAYFVTAKNEPEKITGKKQIAIELANYLEKNIKYLHTINYTVEGGNKE